MRRPNGWRLVSATLVLLLGLIFAGGSPTVAQETPAADDAAEAEPLPDGFPIGIHSGTCVDPVAEPAYDAGIAEPVQETGETEAVELEEDEAEPAAPPAGDAVGTGVDAPVEAPEEDEAEAGRKQAAQLSETVYKADTELDDVEMQELVAQPHVVIVHQSQEAYATYLACGKIEPLAEEGQIVVLLRPVGDSDTIGVALIEEDGSEAATFIRQSVVDPDVAAATPAA